MAIRIHQQDEAEGGIVQHADGAFSVPSFSAPHKSYTVHVEGRYCECPHHRHTLATCKHLVVAEAVGRARSMRFGARHAEENVTEMCRDIFERLDSNYVASYLLANAVQRYRHSTPAMRGAAWKRHRRTLLLAERDAARDERRAG